MVTCVVVGLVLIGLYQIGGAMTRHPETTAGAGKLLWRLMRK